MLRFLGKKTVLGLEITSSALHLATLSGRGAKLIVHSTHTLELPAGLVAENYASPNLQDPGELSARLKECLAAVGASDGRTALSLPDGIFRVLTIELDELPAKEADRERLIRWRLEKTAAYDVTETVLRYELLRQRERGFTVLACLAKKTVLEQYESALAGAGLETWHIGLSSFNVLNFYTPFISTKSPVFALAYLTPDSFATTVSDAGSARFYRYKEVKRGTSDEIRARFVREIEDSIHFYTHVDRMQTSPVRNLYLAGESASCRLGDIADNISASSSLAVEILSPESVVGTAAGPARASLAAALGAGNSL